MIIILGKPGKPAAVVYPAFLGGWFLKFIFQDDFNIFLQRSTESLDKKKKYGLPARPFKFGRS